MSLNKYNCLICGGEFEYSEVRIEIASGKYCLSCYKDEVDDTQFDICEKWGNKDG